MSGEGRERPLTCCVGHLQHTLVTGDAGGKLQLQGHQLLAVVGGISGGRESHPT